MTAAQFEDAEGRALVEAIHQRKRWVRGSRVRYWPGFRRGDARGTATVISDGVVKFGGTDCVRIRMDNGGTDYMALTHVEPADET